MNIRKKLEQYGVLIVGLLIGGGFAFGGIASYAGMTGGGGSSGETEFDASLPVSNYQESSFNMSKREQLVAAARNDVVFVNAFYSSQQEKEQMRTFESLPGEFNDRVYVQVVDSSEPSSLLSSYGITEFPTVIVVGSSRGSPSVKVDDITTDNVESAVCQVMRNWGSVSAKCATR